MKREEWELWGEEGRMYRVSECTSCSANLLPSYLANAVVKRIYRSLLANIARKKPERTDKKIMWREGKGRDRIGRKDDGRTQEQSVDETDIASVDFSSLLPRCTLKNSSKERHTELRNQLWTGRRREKKRVRAEGGGWRTPTRERVTAESTPRKNHLKNSEAPMHIIDGPYRLIRRTLQFHHRRNIASARRLFWRWRKLEIFESPI